MLFPTELFRQLTVSKTPTADQQEGAVAANIDLRVARPFDEKGFHINYSAKGSYQESAGDWSPRLGFYASNTWETGIGEIGILGGAAYSSRKYRADGFNTIGFTTVSLGNRCLFATDPQCNSFVTPNNQTGYGNQAQAWPTTVPAGYNFGANGANAERSAHRVRHRRHAGRHVGAFLPRPELCHLAASRTTGHADRRARNHGGNPDDAVGPNDKMEFYIDSLYSEADHPYERNDLNLAVRSINTNVPVNVELNEDNIVTHATIANPIWLKRTGRITRTRISSISTAA